MIALDNGYISDYLVHWTGKNSDEDGFEALKSILGDTRLKLSYNPFFWLDFQTRLLGRMICFTDVPIQHSQDHCEKYGKFGIAFDKRLLAICGAHPVFYYTHSTSEDLKSIVKYLFDGTPNDIPQNILAALRRHYYYSQPYGHNKIESHDAFYYEREWRLVEQTLDADAGKEVTLAKRMDQGLSACYGRLVKEMINGNEILFFKFEKTDVSFIVIPRDYEARVKEFLAEWQMPTLLFEDLITVKE